MARMWPINIIVMCIDVQASLTHTVHVTVSLPQYDKLSYVPELQLYPFEVQCHMFLHRLSSNIEIFSGKAQLSPLQALNPYGRDWRLKAKVVHKFNKQSYSTKEGEDCSRFSAHIVDEHVRYRSKICMKDSQMLPGIAFSSGCFWGAHLLQILP